MHTAPAPAVNVRRPSRDGAPTCDPWRQAIPAAAVITCLLPGTTVPAGSLLKPENRDQLRSIRLYHVVSGKVMAADVVKMKKAKTVEGQWVPIMVHDGTVMVGKATVTKTDIVCSNAVIHVMDTVLLPPTTATK